MSNRSRGSRKSRTSRKLPQPTKGALSKTYAGRYSTADSADRRRRVLSADVNKLGYAETIRSLNLIAVLTKNQAPDASEKIKSDMAWLKKKYRGGKSRQSRKSR